MARHTLHKWIQTRRSPLPHEHESPPSKGDSLTNVSSGARQEDVSRAKKYPMPRVNQNPPTNVIPAKADASEATDEVNPGSTTFRTNYPLTWARPSSTTCPPWQYRAHSRFHVLPEQNPPSKGDSLANASSGARQGDVSTRSGTPEHPASPHHPTSFVNTHLPLRRYSM